MQLVEQWILTAIDGKISEASSGILGGYADDWPKYRERVGYLRALLDVKKLLEAGEPHLLHPARHLPKSVKSY